MTLVILLTACGAPAGPIEREDFPREAAAAYCHQVSCDTVKSYSEGSGDNCQKHNELIWHHRLWAWEHGLAQYCTFNTAGAGQYVRGVYDQTCEAFYLGQEVETEDPLYDCPSG